MDNNCEIIYQDQDIFITSQNGINTNILGVYRHSVVFKKSNRL